MLYVFFRTILRGFFKLVYRLETVDMDNVPESGAVILCPNHISLLDPPLVGTPLQRKLRFLAKYELFQIPLFGPMIRNLGAFPVKRGGVSKESIRLTQNILAQGDALCIFPEGSRRKTEGPGQKGAASFALKTGAVVVPVAIVGNYRPFSKMKLVFGKPIEPHEYSELDQKHAAEKLTESIMNNIYALRKQHQ